MRRLTPLAREPLLRALAGGLKDSAWPARLRCLLDPACSSALHVAIMREPYLGLVLEGQKTIESRFSINRICPFDAVEPGDVIALKAQSGPVVGLASVEHAAFYELDPDTWQSLRRDFAAPLCAADDAFWDQRARARYASLLSICAPLRIAPVAVDKTDRRGWVRLAAASPQQTLAL
jgi:hypothetical protein